MVQEKLVSSEKTKNDDNVYREDLESFLNHDAWQEYYLQDIAKINPKTKNIPHKFVYIDLESVNSGILKNKNIISKEEAPSRAQRVLKMNDIIFQTVRPYQRNNLFFQFDDMNYVASTGYAQIRTKNLVSSEFLYYLLHTDKFVNEVLSRCTGTSYPAINSNDLKRIKVKIPDIFIQNKIASFLSAIDKKIELLEKKHDSYSNLKNSINEKLLNKTISFNNSENQWKVVKLSSILKERKEYDEKNSKYPHVTLSKEGILPKTEEYNRDFLVKDENKKYKVTHLKDICYNPANLKFGVITLNRFGSAIFSPIYVTFEVKNANTEFVAYSIIRNNFINKIRKYEEGTVYERMAVKPSDFLKGTISLPSLEDQEKIADILNHLNKQLELIQKEHDLFISFKKSLLQKMFV